MAVAVVRELRADLPAAAEEGAVAVFEQPGSAVDVRLRLQGEAATGAEYVAFLDADAAAVLAALAAELDIRLERPGVLGDDLDVDDAVAVGDREDVRLAQVFAAAQATVDSRVTMWIRLASRNKDVFSASMAGSNTLMRTKRTSPMTAPLLCSTSSPGTPAGRVNWRSSARERKGGSTSASAGASDERASQAAAAKPIERHKGREPEASQVEVRAWRLSPMR
jgi:hypothetical protein